MNLYDIAIARKLSGGGGGGGGGDFSTAKVRISNNWGGTTTLYGAISLEENALGEGSPACIYPYITVEYGGQVPTFDVVLYKGSSLIFYDDSLSVTADGDATIISEGTLLITGDAGIDIRA